MTDAIPSEDNVRDMLGDMQDFWRERDLLVHEGRQHLAMQNEVQFPDVAHFTPQKLLMGEVRAFVTERQAQFRPERVVQVVPFGISEKAQALSSRLEKAINNMLYWTSQGRDEWGKCIADAFVFESAWERWEPTPYAAWPKLIVGEDGMDVIAAEALAKNPYATDEELAALRDAYKRQSQKLPLTNHYVPLEQCFPAHNGSELDYVLEFEYRPLRSLDRNPLFDKGAVARILAGTRDKEHNVRNQITIIRYSDAEWYAYYALTPGDDVLTEDRTRPQKDPLAARHLGGRPVLLHAYQHKAGRPLYNEIFGAFGGWGGGSDWSYVAGKVRAILNLASASDNLASQAMTIARNEAWGGHKITISPNRPRTQDDGQPILDGLQGKLGEDIILYPDEAMEPLFPSRPNPYYAIISDKIERQFQKVAGSSSLYGQHQAGTATGYQEQLQIARSEGQFARVQQGISRSGAEGVYLALSLIKGMGERTYIQSRSAIRDLSYYEQVYIDPDDLDPMPMLDVTIEAPSPQDWTASLADFRAATSVVGEGQQALATNTAREKMLGISQPEEEGMKIRIEQMENKFWSSDQPFQMLVQKMLMRSVSTSTPTLPDQAIAQAMADPSFAGQMQQFSQGQQPPADPMGGPPTGPPPPGGAPPPAPPENSGIGQGIGGGLPSGQVQPMQTIGRENQILGQQG